MELLDTMQRNFNIRNFAKTPVPVADLQKMVQRAILAPSINNQNVFNFLAITNSGLLHHLGRTVSETLDEIFPDTTLSNHKVTKNAIKRMGTFFQDAPAVIFVLMKPYKAITDRLVHDDNNFHNEMNNRNDHPDLQSLGAMIENLLLSATECGYGASWLNDHLMAREQLEDILGISGEYRLASAVAIGVPEMQKEPKVLPDIKQIFSVID